MKSLLGVLKSRWFITLIGVVALSLIIWFVGPLIAIADYKPLSTDWVRMLVIMALLLIWGCSNIYRLTKAKQNEAKLATGITQTSESSAEYDVSAVKSQFSEAVQILKRASGNKKRNSQYLYELPWYLLIGPPGSGKTTALVNSGLEFPLEDKYGKNSVKGVGGTRNCDWWFTNEAVLIDTAGRYTTQDSHVQSDSAEWKSFIELLKKYRKRRPINGVLVAISIEDIILKTEAEKERQIKAVRARLQELIDDLGINVPVYLLFTKCDLIEGFVESFEPLTKDLRDQVWGMTLSAEQAKGEVHYQQWFNHEYDVLIDRLQSQQMNKFYFERDVQRRSKIINFPHQLKTIGVQLSDFVGRAFSDSRFHDQFKLRGIYFTSGTQESTSLNRAISQMANPLGIQTRQMLQQPHQGRSYFLKNLLHQVVFPEAELVSVNRKHEQIGHWLRATTAIACLALLTLMGFGLSASFGNNQLNLNAIISKTEQYTALYENLNNDSKPIDLIPLTELRNEMQQVFQQQGGWFKNLGLYQGDKVDTALLEHVDNATQGMFLAALKNELEQALKANTDKPDQLRYILKAYLMFNDQEHFDQEYIVNWFNSYWKNKYFDQPGEIKQLGDELNQLMADFPFSAIDDNLVAQARKIIRRVPLDQQIFRAIELEAEHKYSRNYRFADVLGSDFYRAFDQGDHRIPMLYVYEGYNDIFKPGLESAIEELAEDNWVVGTDHGDLTDMDLAQVQSKVEKRYYEEYIAQWEAHLYSVKLKPFDSLTSAAVLVDTLRSGRSPLRGILDEVSLNTQLSMSLVTEEEIKENLQDAQMVARTISPKASKLARIGRLASRNRFANLPENPTSLVDKRFSDIHKFVDAEGNRGAPMDSLIDDLAELQFYIERILNTGSEPEASYQAALARFEGNSQDILAKLRVEARHYPEPLKRWVADITSLVWRQVLGQARVYVSNEYQHSLLPIYSRTIDKRYPFNKRAQRETTLSDFSQFFKNEGVMDLFFKDYLEPFVDTSSRPWRLKTVDGYSLGINRHYLGQFERADRIRELFFGNESEPLVSFSVRPIYLDANVSKFEINMMGDRQVYRHGPPQLMQVDWPSQSLESSISYQFEDYYNARLNDRTEGPWSLFRFIDKYPLKPTKHGNRFHLKMENSGKTAIYEVVAASARSPLGKDHLSEFRLPKSL